MFQDIRWRSFAWPLGIAIFLLVIAPVSARDVRVGVITDGPAARESISADALENAAAAVYGDGLTLIVAPFFLPALYAMWYRVQVDVTRTEGDQVARLATRQLDLPK